MSAERGPPRVLVVSDEMEVGGSQRQITYLLDGLDQAGWRPELAFFRNRSFLVDQLRIQVHHLPKRRRIDIGFMWRYLQLLRHGRYDVVHAFSLTAELYTALACMALRRPPKLVASVRGLYLLQPDWFWRIKRWILGRADAVIANARAGAHAASEKASIPLSHFDVIANGVPMPARLDTAERERLRQALGAPDNRRFGLFVGRLVREKNPSCLLRALAQIDPGQRPWIAMAGDGPLREQVERQRDQSGLRDDVALLGERADASALMQAADFLVLPSSFEGMSNVLMEAMAVGCPIIASDAGGNVELIDDQRNGLSFPVDDDTALAQALLRICADERIGRTLAAAAYADVEARYSIRTMVEATQAVYLRCLAQPRTASAPDGSRTPPSGLHDDPS